MCGRLVFTKLKVAPHERVLAGLGIGLELAVQQRESRVVVCASKTVATGDISCDIAASTPEEIGEQTKMRERHRTRGLPSMPMLLLSRVVPVPSAFMMKMSISRPVLGRDDMK